MMKKKQTTFYLKIVDKTIARVNIVTCNAYIIHTGTSRLDNQPSMTVWLSHPNRLVGTGFLSWYWLRPSADFLKVHYLCVGPQTLSSLAII